MRIFVQLYSSKQDFFCFILKNPLHLVACLVAGSISFQLHSFNVLVSEESTEVDGPKKVNRYLGSVVWVW